MPSQESAISLTVRLRGGKTKVGPDITSIQIALIFLYRVELIGCPPESGLRFPMKILYFSVAGFEVEVS